MLEDLWRNFGGYIRINSSKILLICVIACVLVLIFKFIRRYIGGNSRVCRCLFSMSCSFIVVMTLVGRKKSHYGFKVMPFESYALVLSEMNAEMLLQIIMNIFMYIPFTFFMLCYFEKIKKQVWAVIIAFACTIGIEIMQAILHIGLFEIDDIIHNGIGAVLGVILFRLFTKMRRKLHHKKIKF